MADLAALDTFIRSNPDPRELKRALAVKMTLGPYSQSQIETLLGVTTGFISKWKKIERDLVLGPVKTLVPAV